MATYQGRIGVRSPFYITAKADIGNTILTATLKVYIWGGSIFAKPATPNYTISKTAVTATDNKIIFEVSQLIRDYFIHNGKAYDGLFSGIDDSIYFEYELDLTQTPNAAPATINNYHLAQDGYGYFEDGVNPILPLTITNNLYIPEGKAPKLPVFVFSDGINNIKTYTNTVLTDTVDLTSIESDSGSEIKSSYQTFTAGVDTIELYYDLTLKETINVHYICEPKYTPKSVKFYAKDGMLNEIYMFKRSDTELKTEREEYNAIIGDIAQTFTTDFSYNTANHSYKEYNIIATEAITLNSGFVDESQNEVFKQLLLSERVWIDDKPVKVTQNGLKYQTRVNDKLINYSVSFEYANNVINNIY